MAKMSLIWVASELSRFLYFVFGRCRIPADRWQEALPADSAQDVSSLIGTAWRSIFSSISSFDEHVTDAIRGQAPIKNNFFRLAQMTDSSEVKLTFG